MATPAHLKIVLEGARAIAAFRHSHAKVKLDLREAGLAGASLAGLNLAMADLSRADLTNAGLTGATLYRANLSLARMTGVQLAGANLQGAYLAGADLAGADLTGADLTGATLTAANLEGANLTGADLHQAKLAGARLAGAQLAGAALAGADLTGASLRGAHFRQSDLTKTVLLGADLSSAELDGARLGGAQLPGCRLPGASLAGAQLGRTNFYGADLSGANLAGAHLAQANLCEAVLDATNLTEVNLAEADLAGSSLANAVLAGANLTDADFSRANLRHANLQRADLTRTDCTGAELAGTSFLMAQHLNLANFSLAGLTQADLSGADLSGAHFYGAALSGARLEGVDLRGADCTRALGMTRRATPTEDFALRDGTPEDLEDAIGRVRAKPDREIRRDPRSNFPLVLLGYPERAAYAVLEKGQADFRHPHADDRYGPLSPEDLALLYCHYNMQRHFAFDRGLFKNSPLITAAFASGSRTICLDIGCGPATAGLALAANHPGKRFAYVGVDSAAAMRSRGMACWLAALYEGVIGAGSTADFLESWEGLVPDGEPKNVLLIFSYFFGNSSLDARAIASLAEMVRRWRGHEKTGVMTMAYTNTDHPLAIGKYHKFMNQLGLPTRPRATDKGEWEIMDIPTLLRPL